MDFRLLCVVLGWTFLVAYTSCLRADFLLHAWMHQVARSEEPMAHKWFAQVLYWFLLATGVGTILAGTSLVWLPDGQYAMTKPWVTVSLVGFLALFVWGGIESYKLSQAYKQAGGKALTDEQARATLANPGPMLRAAGRMGAVLGIMLVMIVKPGLLWSLGVVIIGFAASFLWSLLVAILRGSNDGV